MVLAGPREALAVAYVLSGDCHPALLPDLWAGTITRSTGRQVLAITDGAHLWHAFEYKGAVLVDPEQGFTRRVYGLRAALAVVAAQSLAVATEGLRWARTQENPYELLFKSEELLHSRGGERDRYRQARARHATEH